MLTSALIRDHFGLTYMDDDLAVLGRLAGRKVMLNVFKDDIAGWVTGWNGQTATYYLTRYFVPIAERAEIMVGLHLLPSYVAQERFAVAQFDPESGRLIDCAHSIRAYLHRELLEADVEGDNIGEDLDMAREVFGEDFYSASPSQMPYEDVERLMIDRYGGAAVDYQALAFLAKLRGSAYEQRDWLKYGLEAAPECLYFHRELARWYAEQGENTAAAQSFARSLACYHHTAYGRFSESYWTLGRALLEKVPLAFSDIAHHDLILDDGEVRMQWLVSLFEQGNVETSVRLLSDFRYDSGTDLHPILFEFLRRHYDILGWTWALTWCDLCALDKDDQAMIYSYRGRPLPQQWDRPVRRWLEQL